MNLWDQIEELLALAHERTLGALMQIVVEHRRRRREAVFSIALIALSAKMANADGVVTSDELRAFAQIFDYPAAEEPKVMMLFRLTQADVAGFDIYADKVASIYADDPAVLEDVLDCLFYIAAADGYIHPNERALLDVAMGAFSLTDEAFMRVKARHMGADKEDPFMVLGVAPDAEAAAIKSAYIALVKANHPDALLARGVPPNIQRIAEHRMAVINTAYEKINAGRL